MFTTYCVCACVLTYNSLLTETSIGAINLQSQHILGKTEQWNFSMSQTGCFIRSTNNRCIHLWLGSQYQTISSRQQTMIIQAQIGVSDMVFHTTFNNVSAISYWSVLLMVEAGIPDENNQPAANHCQTLSQNVVSSTPRHERDSNSQG